MRVFGNLVVLGGKQIIASQHNQKADGLLIEELRASQAQLQAIIDSSPLLIMLVDEDRRVCKYNKTLLDMTGRKPGDVSGLRGGEAVRCIYSMDDPEGCGFSTACDDCIVRNTVLDSLKTGKTHREVEANLTVHIEGKPTFLNLLVSSTPFNTLEGKRVIVCIDDVTPLKAAEKKIEERVQQLKQSEERFRQFFNNEPGYCFIISPDGKIIDVNRSALEALGYSRDELVGELLFKLYSSRSKDRANQLFDKWKQTGVLENEEIEVRRKGGDTRLVLLSAKNVRDADGKVLYSVSVQRDVTDIRAMEAQLLQSQKMESVGRLAGGVAHDFNNLLSVIMSSCSFLCEDLSKGDPMIHDINQILEASNRAAALTRQLLAFSRKQLLKPVVVDLNRVLRGLEGMLRRVIGEDIELLVVPGEDLWKTEADVGQIEQIVMNLVVNARDAMPHGGKLIIETENAILDEEYLDTHILEKPGSYVMMTVSDNGEGMDEKTQTRIFEPFFTTKEKGRGTGLGLSTTYGIIKQHGGDVLVCSELGMGTSIKVYLPKADSASIELEVSRPVVKVRGGNEVVLVVEDDAAVLSQVSRVLKRNGYTVLQARNATEGKAAADSQEGPIHLLLTDVVLPGDSGEKLAGRLSAERPDLKVLFMSGYTNDAIDSHGILGKGVNLLHKPFAIDDLSLKVREVLDTQKQALVAPTINK